MPQRRAVDPSEFDDAPAPGGRRAVDPAELESEGEDGGWGGMALAAGGALAAGAGAYALKKLGLGGVGAKIGSAFDAANNFRRQSMLTGLALPKSLLGNVGGAAMSSIERESIEPLKEMLRLPTNFKNAKAAWQAGSHYQGVPSSKWSPGRILGATDDAAQQALVRGGLTAEEAAEDMLQAPLGKNRITDALGTRAGQYFVPFQRTPINQGIGGLETMMDWSTRGKAVANATSLGAGAATGAMTDDKLKPALGAAAMGRRGIPFLIGAYGGRLMSGDTKREAADVLQGVSPVSDYSISEGVYGPLNPSFPRPALLKLLFPEDN